MRILYLADIRFPLERANGIQTAETCAALAARGHFLTLLVRPDTVEPPRDPWRYYDLAPSERLTVRRARVGGPQAIRRLQYISAALLEAMSPRSHDVVLTRDLGVASALLRLPRAWRPPVVYESHGLAPVVGDMMPAVVSGARRASTMKQGRLLRRERRAWHRAEGYVTITATLAAELAHRFGPRHRLAVVPDGVRLPAQPPAPPAARERPVVAYAGHLYPWKGVEVLLRALGDLPEARGLIVGGHPQESDLARLQALARELDVEARVRFTGWVRRSNVPEYLAEADVLVLPNPATPIASRYTSPLKLFEYMAARRPIVASDLPAIREVLTDGENAVLVTPGDPHALAAGIRRVLEDPQLARRVADRAYEDVAAYSWDQRAARFEALLSDVVTRR